MKKKTRVLVFSYSAALVAALAVGLIACRTDAVRRLSAMDANYRHAYGEVLNAVQELDAALQKSLYATTPAMAFSGFSASSASSVTGSAAASALR